jgi:heat shock protein HslJ
VQFGGQSFTGCGGEPMSLLAGAWRAFRGETELGEVTIGADGALNAYAGCNRMFGALQITGEGLAIGPIASTRMACAGDLMARESALARALEASTQFTVDAEGAVRLAGPNGETLRLTRP